MKDYVAYFDFLDGSADLGPFDLSSALLYERLCDDNYGPATNYCKITLRFDSDFLARRAAQTGDIYCRIFEDGEQYFFGRIAPTDHFVSNGITIDGYPDVTDIEIDVEDFSALLEREISEDDKIYWENHYICNPAVPQLSIYHRLLGLCGLPLTLGDLGDEEPTILRAFTTNEGTVKDALKQLLYEYGLVHRFDEHGNAVLFRWLIENPESAMDIDDDLVLTGLDSERMDRDADGAKVVWYPLKDKSDALVYMADLPFGDDGLRSGYPIQPGLLWPEEANVDETWWDYQDTALAKKIQGSLTVKNSDFTQLVLTKNHRIDARVDDGVVQSFSPEFENLRARVAYQHAATVPLNIYYCDIYADVVYRAAKNEIQKSNLVSPKKFTSYEAAYIHDEVPAARLCCALADGYTLGRWRYSFQSETKIALGLRGNLRDPYSGLQVLVLVIERVFDPDTEIYKYKAISIGRVVIESIAKIYRPLPEPTNQNPEPTPSPIQPESSGILAHFSFDDADVSGSVVIDNSGSGHHGIRLGGTVVTGARGRALALTEADTVSADYGDQDLSSGWTVLKILIIASTNADHAAYSSAIALELWLLDGTVRSYIISGIIVNTPYPVGVVHRKSAAEIWINSDVWASYICGPEDIARVVIKLTPHEDIAASVLTVIDEEVDAVRPFTAAEVKGYAAIGMEKKFTWSDYLNALAADGVINPQDKPAISLWFDEINGDGIATGSYWVLRAVAVAAGVSVATFDAAYEAIVAYLYSSPGILISATWADPIYIVVADWAQVKTDYASAATALTTAISDAQAAEAVVSIAPIFKGRITYESLAVTAGNEHDTIVAYDAAIAQCGIYRRESGSWVDQTTPTTEMVAAAWFDVCWALSNGYPNSGTDTDKLQAYIGSGTSYSAMQAYNTILANTIKAISGFFANITVSGKASLQELVLTDVTSGDNLVKSTASGSRICASGTVRVRYSFRRTAEAGTARANVFINGIAVGTEQSNSTAIAAEFIENISISAGDLISAAVLPQYATGQITDFGVYIDQQPGVLKYLGSP
ncbi:MAG TPA: hypothetical protein VN445_09025 [Rectinemataceae bacterium]|nr:hypothetical protein [Rectinemataceae bacterium]